MEESQKRVYKIIYIIMQVVVKPAGKFDNNSPMHLLVTIGGKESRGTLLEKKQLSKIWYLRFNQQLEVVILQND